MGDESSECDVMEDHFKFEEETVEEGMDGRDGRHGRSSLQRDSIGATKLRRISPNGLQQKTIPEHNAFENAPLFNPSDFQFVAGRTRILGLPTSSDDSKYQFCV